MTAVNHAAAGAIIALTIKQPILAVVLAFISHFFMDALPHFGGIGRDVFERNKNRLFQVVVALDSVLFIALLAIVPWIFHDKVSATLLLACMLAAFAPDAGIVYRFWRELKTHSWQAGNWFTRLHLRIERYERPWGLWVEVGLAVILLTSIWKFR